MIFLYLSRVHLNKSLASTDTGEASLSSPPPKPLPPSCNLKFEPIIYPKFLTHLKNHQLARPRGEVMSDFIRGNKYKHHVTCVSHPTYTKN